MRRIPTLDGWRAIAILGVLWYHAAEEYSTLASYGTFGVDLFFGLSGLLITSLLLKQWEETGGISLKAFYVRRVFRILPVYLLYLSVVAAMGAFASSHELASCLLFFRNYLSSGWGRATGHLWSLSIEEHFYLLWPGVLALCGLKWGRYAAGYSAMAFGLWRLVESQANLHMFPGVPPNVRSDLRMDALLWGALVAFTLHDTVAREKLRLQLRFWPWLGMVAGALGSIVYFSNLTSMFLAVLVPMVIAGTSLHPEWLISRLLDSPPVAWIGRISYSLYIWQQLFLVPAWQYPWSFATRLPWNLAVVLATASASYYLVEIPLLRVGGRLAAKFTAPLTPCATPTVLLERAI